MMRNVKFKDSINHRYVVRNPNKVTDGESRNGKRAKFALEKRTYKSAAQREIEKCEAVESETLDSINALFAKGDLKFEMARKAVDALVESLYRKEKAVQAIVHNTDNLGAVQIYLDKKYPEARRKKISDYGTVEYSSYKVAEAMGHKSILSASQKEIQEAIDAFCKGDGNRQRRIIARAKSILSALRPGESFELIKEHEDYKPVKFLTPEEFEQVVPHLKHDYIRTLARVCFTTGCRIGETAALNLSDLRTRPDGNVFILVTKQITREGAKTGKVKPRTKNKKDRIACVFPEGVAPLKEWIKIRSKLTLNDRNHLAETLKAACMEVFPEYPEKHLKWHDLRHCYAIRLLENNTIKDVADMIGDSVVVAEKHYMGFVITDSRMDRVFSTMKKPKRNTS